MHIPGLRIHPLNRKLLRDIWRAKGQVTAVTAVILCGIASYVTVSTAYRNLKLTRDSYYREYRMADFWIPLEQAPESAVFKVEAIQGVTRARGRIVKDVNLDLDEEKETGDPKVGRIITMPERQQPVLNDLYLTSGNYFSGEALDEVILSDRFAKANKLQVGDRISAVVETRKETFKIVGTALTPEYVYMIRGSQEFMPDDDGFGVLWVKEDFAEMILDMRGAVNEIVGTVSNRENLPEILEEAKRILDPYGVFATTEVKDQVSNHYLSSEITGLGVSAKITPSIFLGIAAVILLIMLNRMVKRERTEIGVMKAFGYSSAVVMWQYVKFALFVSVMGWFGGVILGQWLSQGLVKVYQEFYQFPILRSRAYSDVLGMSLLISVACGVGGASFAVLRVLKITPADAMRPEAPKYGGAILLERIAWLWRHISFSWKMILRNLSRYKGRAIFTIVGVAIATGIELIGRFTSDSMQYLMHYQFRELQRHDMKVSFAIERGEDAIRDVGRLDHVRRAEPLFEYPFEVRSRWREKEILITGVPEGSQLYRLKDTDGNPVDLSAGRLVFSTRTARDLGLQPGDEVEIEPMIGKVEKVRTVSVGPPVQLYLGSGAFMDLDALSRLMDENLVANSALLRVERGAELDVSRETDDIPAIAAVSIKDDMVKAFETTLAESMGIMNAILTIFAGVIAFAIIYNSTAITITERRRELASLRVLGFTLDEVRRIVFRENWLLSILGIVFGIPLGLAMCRLMVMAYNTELYRLPFYITTRTYFVSVISILVFVILTNWAARRRIGSLDMVEVLKSRE